MPPARRLAVAVLAPFIAFTAFQAPTATTAHGWEGQQLDARFAKPLPAAEQQFNALTPRGAVPTAATPQGFYSQTPDLRAAKKIVADFGSVPAIRITVAGGPAGWEQSFPSVIVKPTIEQFATFVGPLITAACASTGWEQSFPSVISEPFYEWSGFVTKPAAAAANTAVNWQAISPELFRKPFLSAAQQFDALGLPAESTVSNGNGIIGGFGSVVVTRTVLYQATVTPVFPQTAVVNTAVNWQSLSPEVFGKTVPAASQQYVAHALRQVPTAATPQGWAGYQLDWKFGKAFPVGQQQFATFLQGAISAVATPGWEGLRLDYAFAKPLAAAQQQYTGFFVGSPAAPQGSAGHQLNIVFAKSFPPAQQQFLALMQPLVVLVNTTTWRQQPLNPERFKASFPAALQQYEARGLPTIAPPPDGTTNLPGHGDWPRHLKKKVRPIWDRRPDPYPTPAPAPDGEETTTRAAPQQLVSSQQAPSAATGGENSPYLTRVLLPDLPKPSKPTRKVKRAQARAEARALAETPVLAHGELADDLDTGSALATASIAARADLVEHDTASATASATHLATVLGIDEDEAVTLRSRARLEVGEENDTLSAEATWNDDEIALRLLLGDDQG